MNFLSCRTRMRRTRPRAAWPCPPPAIRPLCLASAPTASELPPRYVFSAQVINLLRDTGQVGRPVTCDSWRSRSGRPRAAVSRHGPDGVGRRRRPELQERELLRRVVLEPVDLAWSDKCAHARFQPDWPARRMQHAGTGQDPEDVRAVLVIMRSSGVTRVINNAVGAQ